MHHNVSFYWRNLMRFLALVVSLLLLTANIALAESYNFITAKQLKEQMTAGKDMIIVDIQVEKEFKEHHLPGSVATYAYPVKTDSERAAIDQAIDTYNQTGKQVVIICPRGQGGAKRCYDYMKSKDVPEEKLTILEKGMEGWPYSDMVEKQ
jgi:rhodanese-related sulfurtransferase